MTDAELTHEIIGSAIAVHKELGPKFARTGMPGSALSGVSLRGILFEKEKPIPAIYKGVKLDCGYRADVVVQGRVMVEIKAITSIAPIHDAVMLTYLRLSGCKIGLLINFYSPVLKDGIKRYV